MDHIIQSFCDEILSFSPEVTVTGDAAEYLVKIVKFSPQILYYIKSYSIVEKEKSSVIRFTYHNQLYPKERVLSPSQTEMELILLRSIMEYETKNVLVIPERMNFNWILKKFMAKSRGFFPNLKSYSLKSFGFKKIPFTVYEVNYSYRIGRVMLRQMDFEVNQEIKRLQKMLFPFDMPDYVKCFIAHNYLATSIEYYDNNDADPLARSYIQSAYGALVMKKCVCQGYAEAFKRLVNESGISCDLVSGRVLSSDEGWHAWNIVHLNRGAENYHVDVTWDSKKNKASHTYLFKGDNFFEGKREWQRYYYSQCSDGIVLLNKAKAYCKNRYQDLIKAGLQPEWIC